MNTSTLKNGQRSKWEYTEGDKCLDGSKISHIVGREEDFIVFFSEEGAVCWEHRDIPDWAYVALDEYEKLNGKIPTYLGQIHKEEIKARMATSLLSAFRLREHTKDSVLACFEDAQRYVCDFESREVLYPGKGFYLYQNNHGLLSIQSSVNNPSIDKTFIEASYLSQKSKHALNGDKLHQANRMIASSFSNHEKFETEDIFLKAREFIDTQINEKARINYISISVIVATISSIILLLAYYHVILSVTHKKIILCSFAGVIGATISVLQRGNKLKPEPYTSKTLLGIQGVIRVFLGVVFGALIPICANADIALGLAKNNIYAIFIIAFFAGINERFVPDLIEKNIAGSSDTEISGQ